MILNSRMQKPLRKNVPKRLIMGFIEIKIRDYSLRSISKKLGNILLNSMEK